MKRIVFALVAAGMLVGGAHAQQKNNEGLKFVVGGGLTFGGEEIGTFHYTNGTSAEIRAGQLLAVHGGLEYRWKDVALQGTVGYHFDRANGSNGSVEFSRIPIEVLGYYHTSSNFRVGGGVRNSTNAKLEGDGVLSGIGSVKFDSRLGFVLEGEYLLGPSMGIKVRYVSEKFEANGVELDGNHGGIYLNGYF